MSHVNVHNQLYCSKCLMYVNQSGKLMRSPLTTDIRYRLKFIISRVSLVATKLLNQMKYYKIFDGWAKISEIVGHKSLMVGQMPAHVYPWLRL